MTVWKNPDAETLEAQQQDMLKDLDSTVDKVFADAQAEGQMKAGNPPPLGLVGLDTKAALQHLSNRFKGVAKIKYKLALLKNKPEDCESIGTLLTVIRLIDAEIERFPNDKASS
jgi:hypothetical protein